MGDEVLVVDSESTARAVVAQRKKQLEVKELEKQVGTWPIMFAAVVMLSCCLPAFLFVRLHALPISPPLRSSSRLRYGQNDGRAELGRAWKSRPPAKLKSLVGYFGCCGVLAEP